MATIETRGEAQRYFAGVLLPELLRQALALGFEVTLGEAWRSPETAELYARAGKGIAHSLHTDRVAIDLNLFKGGVYLTASIDHEPLGLWWEARDPGCRWGGRFTPPDGNHYSFSIWPGRA